MTTKQTLPELIVETLQVLIGRDIKAVGLSWDGSAVIVFDHLGREHRLDLTETGRALCGDCGGDGEVIPADWVPGRWRESAECPTCGGEGALPAPEPAEAS